MATKKKNTNKTPAVETQTGTSVVVFCNLPSGITFPLPDGRKLTFAGCPVSRLVGSDGAALPSCRYGVTHGVRKDDWEYIAKAYARCAYLRPQHPLLFAAATEAEGNARAAELAELRHGLEQCDVWNGDKRLSGKATPYTKD